MDAGRKASSELLQQVADEIGAGHNPHQGLTRTYQLASEGETRLRQADPGNLLLARHDQRRLDAEAIRDSILQVSGELDSSPGRGSVIQGKNILVNEAGNLHAPSAHRSVYLCYLRNSPPPDLAPFNLPDAITVKGQRETATLPAQALFFLNSPFVVQQSERFAGLLMASPAPDDETRIAAAFRRALHREPSPRELEASLRLLQELDAELRGRVPPTEARRRAGHLHGRTNETGATGVEGKVHFRDLHATLFHLLGLDHERLSYRYGAREFRLTGTEKAQVVREILA